MWFVCAVSLAAAQAASPPPATPTPAPVSVLATKAEAPSPSARSLAEVARRIKLRLPEGEEGRTITNESVKSMARGVQLTTAIAAPPVDETGLALDAEEQDRKRAHWQEQYLEAQAELQAAEDEVRRLESEVARLETEFYSTDDPARRDGVVKPAWDRALADLEAARDRLAQARTGPERVRDEALRDGALPGWFRGTLRRNPPPDASQGGGG